MFGQKRIQNLNDYFLEPGSRKEQGVFFTGLQDTIKKSMSLSEGIMKRLKEPAL